MKRHLIPGAMDRHGIAHPLPHCTGSCHGGRSPCKCLTGTTELASTHAPRLELVVSRPTVRWQTSGGRVPRSRRVRRFIRALFRFFTAQRIDL